MQSTHETILLDRPDDGVLKVTLNRPERANAFNTKMAEELFAVWDGLAVRTDGTRCVVLTGAGDRAFCAGADLKERNAMSDSDWHHQHRIFERAAYALMDCPVPVIAAVNGAAFAGGCELVLACDFAYAAETARFALTETTLGLIPGIGGTQNLPRAVGVRRAKEIILGGQPFDAERALAWGLVNCLCPAKKLMEEVLETAGRIAANAPLAVGQAKKALNAAGDADLRTGLGFEIEAYNRVVGSSDRKEGIAAFNEKRKPRFQGR